MKQNFSKPAIYIIKVAGELDSDWSERLAGMQITIEQKTDFIISTLTGRMKDQSDLWGVLNSLFNMHMTILLVKKLEDN